MCDITPGRHHLGKNVIMLNSIYDCYCSDEPQNEPYSVHAASGVT